MKNWITRAKLLKDELIALYFAYKDPRVPWYARLFIIVVVGYALSPIDLIPDFIPFIGYLDDLILIPLGINIALKMIPEYLMIEARKKAEKEIIKIKPMLWIVGAIVILIWALIIVGLIMLVLHFINR